jgi:hypothetical protein
MNMKKKRGLKINLSNRLSYTLIAIFLLAAIGIGVYALAPGVIPNPGHNISEMSVPSPCVAGQVLSYDGTNWVCTTHTPLTKGTAIYAINAACTGGGTLTTSGSSCSFTTVKCAVSVYGNPNVCYYGCDGSSCCDSGQGVAQGICRNSARCLYYSPQSCPQSNTLQGYLVS